MVESHALRRWLGFTVVAGFSLSTAIQCASGTPIDAGGGGAGALAGSNSGAKPGTGGATGGGLGTGSTGTGGKPLPCEQKCGASCCSAEATCTTEGLCVCPSPTDFDCRDGCTNVKTDAHHCGSCMIDCGLGGLCTDGRCSCSAGAIACMGSCVDTQAEPNNCGACNKACGPKEVCSAGKCAGACPAGTKDCARSCADLQTSTLNCGACGNPCTGGSICEGGKCACATGETSCSGTCVDISTDHDNCGACSKACTTNHACSAKNCGCPATLPDECGAAAAAKCVDMGSDSANCGACGKACLNGKTCQVGGCKCPAGKLDCGGTCVDPSSDPNNCGSCSNVCSGGKPYCGSCTQGKNGCPAAGAAAMCVGLPCEGICAPDRQVTGPTRADGYRFEPVGNSGHCYEILNYAPTTQARVVCWEFGSGQSLRLNGAAFPCVLEPGQPVTAKRANGYCLEVTPGGNDYAGLLLPIK